MALLSDDAEVLWTARFDYTAGQAVAPHNHAYRQLIFVIDGAGGLLLDDEELPLVGGRLYLIRRHQHHGLRATSATRTLDVKYRVGRRPLARALEALAPVQASRPERYRDRLQALVSAAESGSPLAPEHCRVRLLQLLLELLADAEETPAPAQATPEALPDDPVIAALAQVLATRATEALDGAALASATGYSYRHLTARCRALLGLTPRQWLQAERIRRAQALLRYSDYPAKAIADRVGFATVHHFSRVFADLVGCGPATWRDRERSHIGEGIVVRPGFANVNRVMDGDAGDPNSPHKIK